MLIPALIFGAYLVTLGAELGSSDRGVIKLSCVSSRLHQDKQEMCLK